MGDAMKHTLLETVRSTVFKESERLDGASPKVEGYDFNKGVNFHELFESMAVTGFQASNLGYAIQIVNQMINWRLSDESPAEDCSEEERDLTYRESVRCKVFLGFTSNLISSGVRENVRFLLQQCMVDVVVTTAGGIEEDLVKCLAPTYIGDFSLPGSALRSKGLNRIGNLLVPNDNYCKFEDWIIPIFDQMLEEQKSQNIVWTPSKVIARLGKEINNEASYLYWAYKNNIPVFCPGLTDGSLGDMLYFHSYKNPGLVIDIVKDIRAMNSEVVHAGPRKTGMIILGGGLPKHHICNANMMRNGADFAVYINTAQEFDGSDSGASPDEAVPWGKIRGSAKTVKVHCDATIAFPLLVANTFAKRSAKKYVPNMALATIDGFEDRTNSVLDAPQPRVVKEALQIEKMHDVEGVPTNAPRISGPTVDLDQPEPSNHAARQCTRGDKGEDRMTKLEKRWITWRRIIQSYVEMLALYWRFYVVSMTIISIPHIIRPDKTRPRPCSCMIFGQGEPLLLFQTSLEGMKCGLPYPGHVFLLYFLAFLIHLGLH